jgi:hypothetical protein
MIARGELPAYRITAPEGRWYVIEAPWLELTATSRQETLNGARRAIVAWLEVDPDAFDVEADRSMGSG